MKVSELCRCNCNHCAVTQLPDSLGPRCSTVEPSGDDNSSHDLQQRSFYSFIVDIISIVAFFFFWMLQVWFFVCSVIFHYGKKLYRADKEVQMLAALILFLMVLSIALKVLFSPMELVQIINMPVEQPIYTPTPPPAPIEIQTPIEIQEEIHLPLPVEIYEEPSIEVEPEPEPEPELPKIQLTFQPKDEDIETTVKEDQQNFMKICLKDKKTKSKDANSDPLKTIKMTLCDDKGKTLFEESTQFYVSEGDGALPTLILTTSPIPINNY